MTHPCSHEFDPRVPAVFPLYCIASSAAGGLALDHASLGTLLAVSSCLQLGYTMFFQARLLRRHGVKRVTLGTTAQGLALALLPVARLAQSSPLRLAATTVLNTLSGCCLSTSVILSIAATNTCASRYPSRKGAINGIATTLESIGKSAGPIGGASLFAGALELPSAPRALGGAGVFFVGFAALLAATYSTVGLALPSALFGPSPLAPRRTSSSTTTMSTTTMRPSATEVRRGCASHDAAPDLSPPTVAAAAGGGAGQEQVVELRTVRGRGERG